MKQNLTLEEWNELANLDYKLSRNILLKEDEERYDYLTNKKK